jgi:pimeloyl-ACP methyl ester carboxylesterase
MATPVSVDRPQSKFVDVGDVRLRYLDWRTGGKPPVLMLHGLAVFAHSWDHNAIALSDVVDIVALDQRGHGESDRGPCEGYRTETFASDILGVADALGWSRFSIVGQSMGGHNGMYLAATHPERIERLVISDMEPIMRLELIAGMRTADSLPEYSDLEEVIAEAQARNPRPDPALQRTRAEHSVRRLPNGRLAPLYDLLAPKCWQALDLWSYLPRITCPTLLVRGAESPVLRTEVARQMVEAMPRCAFVEISGAAHSVGLDNPTDFDAAVRSFLTHSQD